MGGIIIIFLNAISAPARHQWKHCPGPDVAHKQNAKQIKTRRLYVLLPQKVEEQAAVINAYIFMPNADTDAGVDAVMYLVEICSDDR